MTNLVRSGRNPERGIALLTVVAVLVLLTIIATPFLVTMRDGAERGKAVLASSEAASEAETVFRVAIVHLGATDDAVERFAKAEQMKTQVYTPDWDVASEFQVPATLLQSAGLDPESGRIWGVSVEDESAKINVNTAPYTLLGQFFGTSELAEPIDAEATEATLKAEGGLPAVNGVVRLQDEVVRYQRRDGTYLRGLQRGYLSDRPGNGPARKHDVGVRVINEVAFQIAAYPILARRGRMAGKDRNDYAPFSNLYEIRRISDLGVCALPAEQWDRVVEHLTVASRGVVGQTFGDPQTLREPVKAGQDGHKAVLRIENAQRYPIGTTIRITDGANTDYGVVFSMGGSSLIQVVPAFQHDYDAATTRVEALIRVPVNVNTASVEVLTAMHTGLARFTQTPLSQDTARLVAERLVKERAREREDKLPPGIRSLFEYQFFLRDMVKTGGITPEEATACEMNALNPMEGNARYLAYSAVPVVFKSGGIFTVTARAVVLDRTGRQAGRRDFRRLVDVSPQGTSVYEVAGQSELDEILRVTAAKHFTTFPVNVAFEELGGALPSSRFKAFFRQNRWPSTDRSDPTGSLRYAPSRLEYGGSVEDPEHYDTTDFGDGEYMDKDPVALSSGSGKVALGGDSGMEAFSASLWFKPYWGGRRTAFVLDSGKADWEDRIALFYDGGRSEMVFRVKDTSNQQVAAEVRYPFDKSTWDDDRWYHLHVTASGSKPGQMSMIIDGVKRGSPTLLSWTTQAIDSGTNVTTLSVEDADSFPTQGSLLLRGPDGVEVMEYTSRTAGTFQVQRRFARMNRADTIDDSSRAIKRSFPAGTSVQLYGYSIPVTSVIPEAGGTLASTLGRFNVLALTGTGNASWPSSSSTLQGNSNSAPAVALLQGWRGNPLRLNLSSDLSGWGNSANPASAFGGSGSRGYALLVCTDNPILGPTNSDTFGGTEVCAFEVAGGDLVLTRGVAPPPHLKAGNTKYYIDRSNGAALSFIPRHDYTDTKNKLIPIIKGGNYDPDGRLYRDDSIADVGVISLVVPISVEVAGADAGKFLSPGSQRDYTPRTLYAQIGKEGGAEWFKYDSVVQDSTISPNVLLVRDRTADRLATLFRSTARLLTPIPEEEPPVPEPPPGPGTPPTPVPPEDDGGGGSPEDPPVPGDPGGGEDDGGGGTPEDPPLPGDPGPGEDDGPPTGGGDTPPLPGDEGGGEDDGPGGEPENPPPPEDSGGGGEDDGPPTGGGDTPPPPEDGGGSTPPPDDGGGGGEPPDTGGGGTPSPGGSPAGGSGTTGGSTTSPPLPFNGNGAYPHFIARFLDFRSTGDQDGKTPIPASATAAEVPVLIGDILAKESHAAGVTVVSCFLVAFPGIEYDPQGDGASVEQDLDEFVRANRPLNPNQTSGNGGVAGGPAGGTSTDLMASVAAAPTIGKPGDKIEQGSTNLIGSFIEPGPGSNDEVTLVSGDTRETHVVNWSTQSRDWTARYWYLSPTSGGFRRNWTFVAFKEPTTKLFSWNYDRFKGTTASAQAQDVQNYLLGTTAMGDPRTFTRLVKSPSGELPSRVSGTVNVGANWNGEQFAPAVVDEIRFTSRKSTSLVNHRTFHLGVAPVNGAEGKGIDAQTTTLPIHRVEAWTSGILAQGVRATGGILRIDDELIGYSDFDTSTQSFTGCERGAFGSEARAHDYGAETSFVHGIATSRLAETVSGTSARIQLASTAGFPAVSGGFIRIGQEILGFTRVGADGVLEMPEGRQIKDNGKFDPYADADQGAGLFRARYGTAAATHEQGALAYHLDHRYPDVVRELADHPQMGTYEVSRNVKGALWKRVSWDQRLRTLNGIRVIVRFEGGPAWDSDRVVRLDSDPMPETDRVKYLYEVTDPRKLNLLDVQSDRIECRVHFTYEKGAWNTDVTPSSDAWKETPWLKAFRIEYAAPAGVLTTEDLR